MVIDFSRMSLSAESLTFSLPHEFNHQIHDQKPEDPDADTVLSKIVGEGFATYFNYLFWDEKYSISRNLGYTEEEWSWSKAHEARIFAEAETYFYSKKRSDRDLFASRGARLLEEGPTAIGYFIGFRICQAYVARHGKDSWKDLYRLPVRQVFESSGYRP